METNKNLQDGITWEIKFDAVFYFEIGTEKVRPKLPPGVYPVEVRPGVCLFGIGLQEFKPGNLGYLPAHYEINGMIAVQPDLSRNMPSPKFCFNCLVIASENEAFLQHTKEVDKMPTYLSEGLKIDYTDDPVKVTATDNNGFILRLENTQPQINCTPVEMWGQCFNMAEGKLYFQAWKWEGDIFQHQHRGIVGEINKTHPIWQGLDLSEVSNRCYMQLMPRPAGNMRITFYKPLVARTYTGNVLKQAVK